MSIRYFWKMVISEINNACYYRNKSKWLEQGKEGQFVIINVGRCCSFATTEKEGEEIIIKLKLKPPFFIIKEILKQEPRYKMRSPRSARKNHKKQIWPFPLKGSFFVKIGEFYV